jgi:hypothetical protein
MADIAVPTAHAYKPLGEYLQRRYADRIVLTFDQIESLLGFTLPQAALASDTWWQEASSATKSPQSTSWIDAGRTATVNLMGRSVLFERR